MKRFLVVSWLIVATGATTVAADERQELQMYLKRGFEYAEKQDYEKARRSFDTAVSKYPNNADVHYCRGSYNVDRHNYYQALIDFDNTLKLAPTAVMAMVARGVTFVRLGQYDRGLAEYEKVLSLHPEGAYRAAVLNARAWLEATCPDPKFRNGQKALVDAQRAVDFGGWRKASCLGTLAAAYAEVGDFDAAIKYQEMAIAAATNEDKPRDAEKHLACFREHRPYRDQP